MTLTSLDRWYEGAFHHLGAMFPHAKYPGDRCIFHCNRKRLVGCWSADALADARHPRCVLQAQLSGMIIGILFLTSFHSTVLCVTNEQAFSTESAEAGCAVAGLGQDSTSVASRMVPMSSLRATCCEGVHCLCRRPGQPICRKGVTRVGTRASQRPMAPRRSR